MSHFSSENSSFYSHEKLQYIACACYRNGMQVAAIARINEGLDGGSQKSVIVYFLNPIFSASRANKEVHVCLI